MIGHFVSYLRTPLAHLCEHIWTGWLVGDMSHCTARTTIPICFTTCSSNSQKSRLLIQEFKGQMIKTAFRLFLAFNLFLQYNISQHSYKHQWFLITSISFLILNISRIWSGKFYVIYVKGDTELRQWEIFWRKKCWFYKIATFGGCSM